MKTVVIKFGLFGLFFSLALFLAVLYVGMGLDFNTQEVLGYLTILVALSTIFFGIMHYRDRVNAGKISFLKGLLIGLLITLITAIGIAIADFIYTTFINPDFFNDYARMMRDKGYTGVIQDYGSGFMAVIMYLTVLILGLLVSLLAALVLKRG